MARSIIIGTLRKCFLSRSNWQWHVWGRLDLSARLCEGEKLQECCTNSFPLFIDKDHWPRNSPDLIPLDSCIWNEIAQVIKWNEVTYEKTLITDALKRAVKKIFSLKVVCLGPIDYIECPKTKEITLNNKIQHFCRELKGKFFKKKIRSKDWKLKDIIEKKWTLHLFWPARYM